MFQANIDCGRLADALNAVSVLVEECKIQLDEDGISIRAVDPANVGMVDLFLDTGAFESYSATDGSVIGVNLERFQDIIGMGNSGDIMSLELDEEARKLNLEVDGLSYTLALIDPDSIRQEPDIPDLDLSSELVAEQGQLDRGITAADMVSDHITLSVEPEENAFYIEAEGDTDDVDLKLNEDELVSLTPGDTESMFSLDYLKDMNKGMPNGGEITTELGSEFPAKFHFKVADGTGHVTYMLAPRIQSD